MVRLAMFIGMTMAVAFSFSTYAAQKSAGKYACHLADAYDLNSNTDEVRTSDHVQNALNSMNCDTTKPITTSPFVTPSDHGSDTTWILVCCVKK